MILAFVIKNNVNAYNGVVMHRGSHHIQISTIPDNDTDEKVGSVDVASYQQNSQFTYVMLVYKLSDSHTDALYFMVQSNTWSPQKKDNKVEKIHGHIHLERDIL